MKKSLSIKLLLSYTFFLGLLLLSLLFYQERATVMDASFQIFCVINDESLSIQVQRFGAIIVQILPLALTKMGASTALILQTYSASFILYPLLLFAFAVHVARNLRMAFAIVLFFLLMQVHTFYWIQSELIQGCVFSLFFLCLYSKYPKTRYGLIGYLLGAIVIVYAHPLAIIALLYGLGYLFLDDKTYRTSSFWIIILGIVLCLFYKYQWATIGQYDNKALGMFDGFEERLPNLFQLASTQFFLERMLSTYYVLLLGIIAVIVGFIWQRKWRALGWFSLAIIGWLLLILTTYHWRAQQFYIESFYLMLSLFVAIPLAWSFWPLMGKKPWLSSAVLGVLIIVRISQIWDASGFYQDRLAWNKTIMENMRQQDGNHFYLLKQEIPIHLIQLEWALTFELLLLAAIEEENPANVFYLVEKDADARNILASGEGFSHPAGLIRYYSLSSRFAIDKEERKVKKLKLNN